MPRHLQASLSYHPAEAKREGSQALLISHHRHSLYVSLKVKGSQLITNMKTSSGWSLSISCSESCLCHAPRGEAGPRAWLQEPPSHQHGISAVQREVAPGGLRGS